MHLSYFFQHPEDVRSVCQIVCCLTQFYRYARSTGIFFMSTWLFSILQNEFSYPLINKNNIYDKRRSLLTDTHPELIHPGSSLQETTVTATPGICTSSSGFPALTDTSRWYASREVSFNTSHIVFTILSTSSSSCSTVTDKRSRTAETRLVGSRKNSTLGCKVLAVRQRRGSGAEWGDDMTMVPSTCGSANSWVARICKRDRMSAIKQY